MKNLNKEDEPTDNKIQPLQKTPTSARTKPSLLEAAKQGNPKAIAKLMNRSLQPKGTTAKVALDNDCLQVMLESSQVPATSLAGVIRQGLINLGVKSIKQVKVYGRQIGEEIPDWSQDFELIIPTHSTTSVVSPSPPSANNKDSELKSQQQKVSQPKLAKWKIPVFIGTITVLVIVGVCASLAQLLGIIETFNGRNSNPTSLSQSNLPLPESKQYESELTAASKAIQANPNNHQAWYNKGKVLFNLERHQEALAAYDKAIQINPNYIQAWSERSLVLRRLGRFDEALTSAEKALQINPNFADGWKNRCGALITLQRNQEALSACDKAVELKPDFSQAWYNRGLVLMNLKQYEDSLTSFDKAVQLKPDYDKAWYERGILLRYLQRYEEAVTSYDKAVEINPKFYQAWISRGNALISLQRYEEAITSFEKALQIRNSPAAWYGRGYALYDLGRYEEALACYNKAIQIYPNYADAWYERGLTLEKLGRDKEALRSYNKAIQIESFPQVERAKEKLLRRLGK
jgi:tetratricopeptide (TPR) repeat protein